MNDEEYSTDIARFDKMMDDQSKKKVPENWIHICPNCRTVPSRSIGYMSDSVSYKCNCGYPGPPTIIEEHELENSEELDKKLDKIKDDYFRSR